MTAPDTAVARKLDFMRPDIEEPGSSPAARLIAGHAALLVAAVEAVLALPGKWEKETARLDGINEDSTDPQQRAAISMRAQAFEECARDLRMSITAALTGGERSDGR